MLIPNLSVLLAQRRLTITRVSQDTRISRTTLTALCSGNAKGVQFDTLNALCQYLKIAPGDLFLYRPFDLSVRCEGRLGSSRVEFTLRRASRPDERITLNCDARLLPSDISNVQYPYTDTPAPSDRDAQIFSPDVPCLKTLRVRLTLPDDADPAAPRARELADLLRDLPAPALADLELSILRAFDQNLAPTLSSPDLLPSDYSPDLLWPWQP